MERRASATVWMVTGLWLALPPEAAAALQAPANHDRFTVAGLVVDLTGAPVPGARVQASRGGRVVADAVTGRDGTFAIELARGVLDVTATAHGLAPASVRVNVPPSPDDNPPLQLVLGAPVFSASVTVAAPAANPGGTEGSSSVLTAEAIGFLPARGLDELLATTPGFSLFRRAPSRTANPTAQGVSLRGLGASGASRALVSADGFPANDPFGGWVYWSRLPVVAIERVEVARGGRSDRHGADAAGGAIGIVTSQTSSPMARRLLAAAGSLGTGKVSAFGGIQRGPWNAVASGEAGRAGQAPIVAPEERGPVDTPAGSDHAAGLVGVSWAPSAALTLSVRANPFGERRANGTPLQRNDTRALQMAAAGGGAAAAGQWEVRTWGQWARFRQTFSIVSRDRTSEVLASRQRVESTAAGARAGWNRVFGPAGVSAGVEVRQVEADNVEGPAAGAARTVGGRQRGPAVFGRMSVPVGQGVRVDAGARWERWSNTPSHLSAGSRAESRFSPRLTVTWAPVQGVVAHAAASGAFRAPTLNELYRGFRVGAIVTLPNEELRPERLKGVEAGVGFTRRRLALRATGWWSRMDDSVANVTIGVLERQRQNVGGVDGRGLEVEAVVRPVSGLEWSGAVALTRSVFDDRLRPVLDGRDVPQVPVAQWSSRLGYGSERGWAALELRGAGRQFEDDRNQLPLRAYAAMDVTAGYRVARRVELLFSVENVADTEIEVGRTPVPTVGLPRSVHVGIRVVGGR